MKNAKKNVQIDQKRQAPVPFPAQELNYFFFYVKQAVTVHSMLMPLPSSVHLLCSAQT